MDRLSSARISTTASEFLEAGEIVTATSQDHSLPAYFLFAQSIELSLKAYLRAKSYSENDLRDISHDIVLALTKARTEGLDAFLKVTASDVALIKDLGFHYRSKDLQYTKVGLKRRYPRIEDVQEFAKRLLAGIRPFAIQQIHLHHGKATAVL